MTLSLEPETRTPGPTTSAAPVIETIALRKEYGRAVALHDLTLTVEPGEVFGFLGPNGAGKTTAVKILLGLVHPTSGEARLFGQPIDDASVRRRIGYLPENFRFQDWFTGAQLLDFHGRLAGLSADERRTRIPRVLRQVGLEGRGDDRLRGYSKGMTQRIGLAQAILHRPDLALLDEPTSALDPIGRREVRDLVRVLRSEGMTVFLNSHLLSEVELVCDRVAIIDRGRVVRAGHLADLLSDTSEIRLTVDRVDADLRVVLGRHARIVSVEGTSVTLAASDLDAAPAIAETVIRSGYRLFGLVPLQQSLEEVFFHSVEGGEG